MLVSFVSVSPTGVLAPSNRQTASNRADVPFTDGTPAYVDAMVNFEDPLYQNILSQLPKGSKAADYITSLEIQARKPAKS